MAKKMISVKVDEHIIQLLKNLAEQENRSQGQEIQYLIEREAKALKVIENLIKP